VITKIAVILLLMPLMVTGIEVEERESPMILAGLEVACQGAVVLLSIVIGPGQVVPQRSQPAFDPARFGSLDSLAAPLDLFIGTFRDNGNHVGSIHRPRPERIGIAVDEHLVECLA